MKELSLNILDITENSVKAGATLTRIEIDETDETFVITITDDGCGMKPEMVATVTDPFCTTRTTRKVGMGLPLLKLEAEQTGGELTVESRCAEDFPEDHGTVVRASFFKNHIDFTPAGDLVSSVTTLIQGHPDTDFFFRHSLPDGNAVELDTRELREVLGDDIPLNSYDVIKWIEGSLREQYAGEPTA